MEKCPLNNVKVSSKELLSQILSSLKAYALFVIRCGISLSHCARLIGFITQYTNYFIYLFQWKDFCLIKLQ